MDDWLSHVFTTIFGAIVALGVAFWKGRSVTKVAIEEQVSSRIEAVFKRHEADFERYTSEIKATQKERDELRLLLIEARAEIALLRTEIKQLKESRT